MRYGDRNREDVRREAAGSGGRSRRWASKPLLGLAALALSCAPAKYLTWNGRAAAPAPVGRVQITITDAREEKKGGKEPRAVGMQPGAFGMAEVIRLPKAGDVAASLETLLAQATRAAGVGVSPPGDTAATGTLDAELQTFWCWGLYPVYKVEVAARVSLTNRDGTIALPPAQLNAAGDDTDCQSAYRKVLTQLFDRAVVLVRKTIPPPAPVTTIAVEPSPSPAPSIPAL